MTTTTTLRPATMQEAQEEEIARLCNGYERIHNECMLLRAELNAAIIGQRALESAIRALPETLARYCVVQREAVDDADDYDDGVTLRRVRRVIRHMLGDVTGETHGI